MCAARCEHARRRLDSRPHLTPDPTRSGNGAQHRSGKLIDVVAHVANGLAAFGEKLSAGDIIITGSITPPVMIEPDETEIAHAIDPIGEVSVRFSRD